MKWLGVIFAILASVCGLGIGCSVPANAVVSIVKQNFAGSESSGRIITYVMAVVLCILVGLAIISGVKSITKVSEKLVPFMAIFYVLGCLIILVMNADVMGETFSTAL